MNTMNRRLSCAIVITVSLNLLAQAAPRDLLAHTGDAEARIQNDLESFAEAKDGERLEDAYEAVKLLYRRRGTKDWNLVRDRVLFLQLEILEECYEARDQTYDLDRKTRPVFRPPVLLSPKEKEDPEARKQYDRKMAEYRMHADKRRQELLLQRLYDRIVRDLKVHLEAVDNNPELNRDEDIAVIKRTIEDDALREEVLRQVNEQ